LDWFSKYPPERFMGISSNDIAGVMGYGVEEETAIRDTVEAWQSGIGYHFSTDAYTRLPSWFEEYQQGLSEFVTTGLKLGELSAKAVDTEGNEIDGLWIEVRKSGRTVATGFSPAKFMLPEGAHQVFASNYQNYIFSKWQDGSTLIHYPVNVAEGAPLEVTAIYRNELADLHIDAADLSGNPIKGVELSVLREGKVVGEGKNPIHLQLPIGTYSISATSSKYFKFDHWSDSSRSNMTAVDLGHDVKYVAYYSSALETHLAEFGCGSDFGSKVADSMLRDGVLGGMFEIHMRKGISGGTC
jgi:hypothetical protein